MRKALSSALAVLLCIAVAAQEGNFWTGVSEARITKDLFANRFKPAAYKIFQLNETALSAALRTVPFRVDVRRLGMKLTRSSSHLNRNLTLSVRNQLQ